MPTKKSLSYIKTKVETVTENIEELKRKIDTITRYQKPKNLPLS